MNKNDKRLTELFLEPIRKCANYKPAFGQARSKGFDLADFQTLYGQDSFYTWIGLDDPLLYAAHKAAGGLTSVYRQVGIGSERLLRAVIMDSLGLTNEQIDWEYRYPKPDGKTGVHILDAKIAISDLQKDSKTQFKDWLKNALKQVETSSQKKRPAGAAFEIRQGYKSADSKRQNADLRFGIRAYQSNLIPVFAVLSSQVSEPVIRRYKSDGMLVLTGVKNEDPTISTFSFFKEVVGYDLSAFFIRNSTMLKNEVRGIIKNLLTPD